ncbi:Potassium transporter 7, partial [Mucuna pruriens]
MAEEIYDGMLMEFTESLWVIQDEEEEASNIENFDADLRLGSDDDEDNAKQRLICIGPRIDSFNAEALEVPHAYRKN